jgi:hypothetical protein
MGRQSRDKQDRTRDAREAAYQDTQQATGARTIHHVRHSCGHRVFWDDPAYADAVAESPCPWCGGENGVTPPAGVVVHSTLWPGKVTHVRQDPQRMCACEKQGPIIARHRADEACCA